MKKSIALSLAIAATITAISSVSATADLDELSYNPASPALEQERQANFLDALVRRYKNVYNNQKHDRYYYNSYLQQERMEQKKKENNIAGNGTSEMVRSGETETKDRVRTTNTKRLEAANAKQTFRKAAINYYVDGGQGYGSEDAMKMGNVDGMKNTIERRQEVSDEYKFARGAVNLTTRDMVRFAGMREVRPTVKKRNTYYKGNFYDRMTSPFMSTDWLDQ